MADQRERRLFRKKLLIVGDGNVGKTCIYSSYVTKSFPSEYIPRVFESYVASIHIVDSKNDTNIICEFGFWDTVSRRPDDSEDVYNRLRPLSYPYTDIILLCFSLADIETLQHVEDEWYAELNHYCPNVPIILLGTKLDLREDEEYASTNDGQCVTMAEGLRMMAKNANVVRYMECSAITRYGVDEVFDEAARIVCLEQEQERTRKCLIL